MKDSASSSWSSLPVIATVARLLCRELTLQNEYLRTENKVLKAKVRGRIRVTDEDRRTLVDAALAMGRKLMQEVVTLVKPETLLSWQRRVEKEKWDYSNRERREPGRPRTSGDMEALVCRLARENSWGYLRIPGELLKLDLRLSKGCIADILRRNNLPPSPERKGLTWREFLSRHAEVMLSADLFAKEIWTFVQMSFWTLWESLDRARTARSSHGHALIDSNATRGTRPAYIRSSPEACRQRCCWKC